jgi:hypothetical protein
MKNLKAKAIHILAFISLTAFYIWQTDRCGTPIAVYRLLGVMFVAWAIAALSRKDNHNE